MVNYVLVFFGGVGLGIIAIFLGLLATKKLNLVTGLWALCGTLGILGLLCGLGGVYIETFTGKPLGLWLIVFSAILLAMCGVSATLGSKYQIERARRSKQ